MARSHIAIKHSNIFLVHFFLLCIKTNRNTLKNGKKIEIVEWKKIAQNQWLLFSKDREPLSLGRSINLPINPKTIPSHTEKLTWKRCNNSEDDYYTFFSCWFRFVLLSGQKLCRSTKNPKLPTQKTKDTFESLRKRKQIYKW